jgi:hypothetical protein
MRRIPRRRDANEPDIIEAFQAHGWSVIRIRGKGEPDLVCAKGQRVLFVEVKMPKGKLTGDQVDWHGSWLGPKPVIVRSVEDVSNLEDEIRKLSFDGLPEEAHRRGFEACRQKVLALLSREEC